MSKITYKNKSIIDYIDKLPNLIIKGSIDALHEKAELYRHNSKWSVIERNIKLMVQCKANFFVQTTVGATNLLHIPDLHRYLITLGLNAEKLHLHFLVHPDFLSAQILPIHLKHEFEEKHKHHIKWLLKKKVSSQCLQNWMYLLSFVNEQHNTHLIPKFISYNNELDEKRNQKFFDVFPELKSLLG